MHPHSAPHRRPARGGFTIIELLIVITIISVLLTLTMQVVGAFITQARDAATQATIRKIQGLLNSRAEAMHRLVKRPSFVDTSLEFNTTEVKQLSNGDINLRRILTIKQLTRKYFPQYQSEVNAQLQPKVAAAPAGSVSSAEILYDFLTQSNVVGDQPPGADAFTALEVSDADGDGLPGFIDAWGNPLRFYRWPTRLFRPAPGYPTIPDPTNGIDATNAKMLFSMLPTFSGNLLIDLARDPDDPLRRLVSATAFSGPNKFENPGTGSLFHTPATYHVLLVVSAGPDGVLGLHEPDDISNNGHLAAVRDQAALTDDITYLNIRSGGK